MQENENTPVLPQKAPGRLRRFLAGKLHPAPGRIHMLDELRGWIASAQGGAIITLHDPVLALNHCDKLLLLAGGQLLGVMSPRIDSLETMEGLLRAVYGPISVQPCKTRSGRTRLLLLKEEEP